MHSLLFRFRWTLSYDLRHVQWRHIEAGWDRLSTAHLHAYILAWSSRCICRVLAHEQSGVHEIYARALNALEWEETSVKSCLLSPIVVDTRNRARIKYYACTHNDTGVTCTNQKHMSRRYIHSNNCPNICKLVYFLHL